jgi:Kef-type K+ transport system membrane component KefB
MDGSVGIGSLVAVAVVALLAPVVLGLLPWLRVPQVVLLLAGGMLIGPDGLRLGAPLEVQVIADVGLGFVFLLAGYEVDLRLFRQDAGRRAVVA